MHGSLSLMYIRAAVCACVRRVRMRSLRPIIDMLSKLLQLELGCASPPIKPTIESRRAMAAKREDAEKAAAAAGGADQ